nr:hypothetical protein [Tanacetum cinerariifolium]
MADQRTMTELLRVPTEGYAEAIVVPPILAERFELKHNLINMMSSEQFFGLDKHTQDVLTIIENKSKVCNSRNKSIVSQVKSSDGNSSYSSSSSVIAKLTHAVNQQTSDVTTAMTTILKQFQATPPPAFVKAVEEIYVTCGGTHPYYQCLATDGNTFLELRDNIQGYISAPAVNYNQGNSGYRPPGVANQIRPSSFPQPNVQNNQNRFSQPQGYNRGNNFNQDSFYQALIQQNQVVPLSSGPLPSNTIANPKGKLKAITTRIILVLDGPFIPMPITTRSGDIILIEKLLNLDSTKDLPLPRNINPLSDNITSFSSIDHLLEVFADELARITFLPGNDDLPFDIKSDLKKIEYLINHDRIKEMDSILENLIDESNPNLNDNLVDTIHVMFTDEHTLDYSSPPLYDYFDDDLDESESDNDDAYNDPFDSKKEKIKESKLLIDELDLPILSYFFPSPEYDSFLFKYFPRLILCFQPTTRTKYLIRIAISHASLILEDFNPPLYEPPFQKEDPESKTLLSFSSENEEKVFKHGILTSKGVYTSLLPELSHRGPKAFRVIKIFESPM